MSRRQRRKFNSLERKFRRIYSAWEETHRVEFAAQWLTLVGELLRLNPNFSVHFPYHSGL